jgi:hypothetical protein
MLERRQLSGKLLLMLQLELSMKWCNCGDRRRRRTTGFWRQWCIDWGPIDASTGGGRVRWTLTLMMMLLL